MAQNVFKGNGLVSLAKAFAEVQVRDRSAMMSDAHAESDYLKILVKASLFNGDSNDALAARNGKLGAFDTATDSWANDSVTLLMSDLKSNAAHGGALDASRIANIPAHVQSAYTDFRASVLTARFNNESEQLFDEESIADMVTVDEDEIVSRISAANDNNGEGLNLNNINQLLRQAQNESHNGRAPNGPSAVSAGLKAGDKIVYPSSTDGGAENGAYTNDGSAGLVLNMSVSFEVNNSPTAQNSIKADFTDSVNCPVMVQID